MPDQEKIRLMTRLSIFEACYGKKIRKAENTGRFDLITNPVWRWGILVTLLFFLVAGTLAALNMDMVLDAVAKDQTGSLIITVLVSWLSSLAVTIVLGFVFSCAGARKLEKLREQYRGMLLELERINMSTHREERSPRRFVPEEEMWETDSGDGRHHGSRTREEDLDYRNMQVLEFEDDDFCYYVEAVPKRGGRRR